MQKTITILEKRQNSETKSDDEFDNYGKYIACQLRGMPEKDREYVQFEIQGIIYQVKSCGINHLFQTAIPHFPGSPPARFSTPNQTMQRQLLEQSQPYNIPRNFTDYLDNKNL